jgi:hypothetical protein
MDVARGISSGQLDKYMEKEDKEFFSKKTPEEIFKDLYALNVRAVNDRYGEDTSIEPPVPYAEVNSGSLEQTLKNLCCLGYQCEEFRDESNQLWVSLCNMYYKADEEEPEGVWDWQ